MPAGAEEGILRGMYLLREARVKRARRQPLQLLGSGPILREVLAAADTLAREHGVAANVLSVTSFSEAARNPDWVAQCLAGTTGPIVAASDYVRAVPGLLHAALPANRRFVTLGTDGFGRSDTRTALRAYFGVDAAAIVRTSLETLKHA